MHPKSSRRADRSADSGSASKSVAAQTNTKRGRGQGMSPTLADSSDADRSNDGLRPVWFFTLAGALVACGIAVLIAGGGGLGLEDSSPVAGITVAPAQYNPRRAMSYLVDVCEIGPRPSGSDAMKRQQEWLTEHFTELGATVRLQPTQIRHPDTGALVDIANLIASWHDDRPKRFLICAHYDTRPFPDRDGRNPKGRFVGANDGGSGVAAMMELAHHMGQLPDDVGVDFVMFDAEEFVFEEERDDYFLGSIFFAQQYRMNPPAIPYQAGVLLDMVADRELKLYFEKNSLRYAKDVTRGLWKVAADLRVREFVQRSRHEIRDDHLPLNQIANIPTVDVIDFDYPRPGVAAPSYWHTEQDVPANCSGESLAVVVWVVHEWLNRQ